MAYPEPLRVLVTRPEGQQAALVSALQARGIAVQHQPLIDVTGFDEPSAEQRALLLELDRFGHVIFVSANAVRFGCEWIERFWPQYPVGIRWYGPGPSTAALLAQRGLKAISPPRRFDSEGLLAVPTLQNLTDARVLIVKGEGGRAMLHNTCVDRGAIVAELLCYKRRQRCITASQLRTILAQVDVITLSSTSAVSQWAGLLQQVDCPGAKQLTVVVPGDPAAQRARDMGFTDVVAAHSATDAAFVAAITDIGTRERQL